MNAPRVSLFAVVALVLAAGCVKKKQATAEEFKAGTATVAAAVSTWLKTSTPENLAAAMKAGDDFIDPLDDAFMKANFPAWDNVRLLRGTLRLAKGAADPKAVPPPRTSRRGRWSPARSRW